MAYPNSESSAVIFFKCYGFVVVVFNEVRGKQFGLILVGCYKLKCH